MRAVVIRDARVPAEMPVVRALFDEYAASLHVDLSFQDFASELAELPGEYAAPHGCLLVVVDGGDRWAWPPHARGRSDDLRASHSDVRPWGGPSGSRASLLPEGVGFDARDGPSRLIGCVALRALAGGEETQGEIKRLYLRPAARGRGVGRELALAAITRARAIGYRSLKLDTLASMRSARALYSSLGFRECAPYYRNPLPGTTYMELALA